MTAEKYLLLLAAIYIAPNMSPVARIVCSAAALLSAGGFAVYHLL